MPSESLCAARSWKQSQFISSIAWARSVNHGSISDRLNMTASMLCFFSTIPSGMFSRFCKVALYTERDAKWFFILVLLYTELKLYIHIWIKEILTLGHVRFKNIKGNLSSFSHLFSPFLQCFICSCACKRSRKLERSMFALVEAPLSHRKHCSWNASSTVPPSILWFCDITLHHHFLVIYA